MPPAIKRPAVGLQYRVSSIKQVQQGHSIETQRDDVVAKADALFGAGGYEQRHYADKGVSGTLGTRDMSWLTRESRDGLSRLLEDAEKGLLTAVIFPSVDRFARREVVFWNAVEKLLKYGVDVYFADMDLDLRTEEGAMTAGVLQSVASAFSRRQRRRIARAFAQRRTEGYAAGGVPPFGWRWEKPEEKKSRRRGFVPDENTAPWVRFMRDKYLNEAWTTTQIAEELNRRGVRRGGGGTHWDSSQVRKVLTGTFHTGHILEKDGSLVPGAHYELRFWDVEDRERILERLRRNRKMGSRTVVAQNWPLLGVIRCGICGVRLRGIAPNGTRRSYHCFRVQHADGSRCPGVSKIADPVEAIVLKEVRRLASSEDVQALALVEAERMLNDEDGSLVEQADAIERELGRLDGRRAALVDMRADGELTKEGFAEQQRRMDEQRVALTEEMERARKDLAARKARKLEMDRVRKALADFDGVWDALDEKQRRELLLTVTEEMSLRPAEDETGDVVLRLKLRFLPAQEYRLPKLV
jgi:site-specific DNA recombinase